jgi:hypothetical protein
MAKKQLLLIALSGVLISSGSMPMLAAMAQPAFEPSANNSVDRQPRRAFQFPLSSCPGFTAPNIQRPPTGTEIRRYNRIFTERKACEDRSMLTDRQALSNYVTLLGGTSSQNGDQFEWNLPFDCHCRAEMESLVTELYRRDQDRISKYQSDYYKSAKALRAQKRAKY